VPSRFVLIGAGQCAVSAAEALRGRGFDGELVLVGAEAELPYERPPLSKGYLLGKTAATGLTIKEAAWFTEHAVQLRLRTSVDRIEPGDRLLYLSTGERLNYDAALIATGGRPRRLPGISGDRVAYLRTRRDADALAGQIRRTGEIIILGGGFIGCEVAAAARSLGAAVTVLEMHDAPMQAVFGPVVGRAIARIHQAAGVAFRTGERVRRVTEHPGGLVVHTDRAELPCGLLLVAAGIRPNVEFLASSGLDLADGVPVDEYCRTGIEGIFAAGDVAAAYHPLFETRVRVEHFDNAIKHGAAAAASMLGSDEPFRDPHWFWSDQYEHSLQSVGIAPGHDRVVVRGSVDEADFSAFYLADGVVRSVFALNRAKDVIIGRRMVLRQLSPDPAALMDTDFDLHELVGSGRQKSRVHATQRPGVS
jgi:3-phenylpropionate/trans-cinnamate dioxygenase ferredoxin reductase component